MAAVTPGPGEAGAGPAGASEGLVETDGRPPAPDTPDTPDVPTASAEGAAGVPDPGRTGSEATPTPGPALADVTGPLQRTHPARPRRRTALLAGVAVAAVLGAAALAMNLPTDGSQGNDDREGSVGAAASKDVTAPPAKASPQSSPSGSRSAEPGGTNSPRPPRTRRRTGPTAVRTPVTRPTPRHR